MNPLKSVTGTIIAGFVLAAIILAALTAQSGFNLNLWSLFIWLHVVVGVLWIGLLYYFNFVQVPGVRQALADKEPGPAAINKYIAPRALLWFRWAAVATWFTGVAALESMGIGFMQTFLFQNDATILAIGAWLGTIMLINVWVFIWPNQKKILGMKEASADEIVKAKGVALMASRTNTLLSIPMLMCMVGHAHGLPM